MKHQKDEAAPLERDGLSQSDTQPVDSTRSESDLDGELDKVAGIGSPLEEERELKRLNKKSGMSIMPPCDATKTAPGSISAFARVTDRLERGGSKSVQRGMWQCPAHDDRSPSLHVTEEHNRVLLNCFAGCATPKILSALGLEMADLYDRRAVSVRPSPQRGKRSVEPVAAYEYFDSGGALLSTKRRWEPGRNGQSKSFDWTNGNPHVLFNLPFVIEAKDIWLNEGEKGANKLQEILPLGHAATCAPTSVWEASFNEILREKAVTIVCDRDESGEQQARQAYVALKEARIDVRVVKAAVEKEKADAFDHVEAVLSIDEFVAVDLDASPGMPEPKNARSRSVRSRTLDTIPQRPIEWDWNGKIERGAPMLLDGDGDAGKTTVACYLAAAFTAGAKWPDGTPVERHGHVGWIEADPDGFGTKIAPIIAKAGGDLSMVHEITLNDPAVYGGSRLPMLPDDLEVLIPFLKEQQIEMLVLSPVSALLSKGYNPNVERDVRGAMMPVTSALGEIRCSQIWIRHLTKNPAMISASAKGLGTVGWRAIARSALFLSRDESCDEDGRRVLAVTKANNAPDHDRSGLTFRFVGEMGEVPEIEWLGETDIDPDSLVSDAEGKLGECRRWVLSLYEDNPGLAIATKDLLRRGKEAGFSDTTTKRAYQAETINSSDRKSDGTVATWLRILPGDR